MCWNSGFLEFCCNSFISLTMFGLSVVGVGCFSLFFLRGRKVKRDSRVCFERIDSAGFSRNDQLRAIDKSIALSVPPCADSSASTPLSTTSPSSPPKPFKKGLLLIGGFGDPPHVWEGLAERASLAGWYTLAPRTPGWGRTDFHEANHVSWTDWVLAARDGLAAVRGLCEEVTVVAHSTGAPVAAIVAESFPIETLVFTGPNFVSNPSDLWAKKLLLTPVLGRIVTSYLRTVVKKKRMGRPIDSLNEEAFPTAYYLTCLPVHALREMWILQNQLSRPWQVSSKVMMLMGESDQSVAPLPEQAQFVAPFLPKNIPFHFLWIPGAAHGLPTETKGVVDALAKVVLDDPVALDKLMHEPQNSNGNAVIKGDIGQVDARAADKKLL